LEGSQPLATSIRSDVAPDLDGPDRSATPSSDRSDGSTRNVGVRQTLRPGPATTALTHTAPPTRRSHVSSRHDDLSCLELNLTSFWDDPRNPTLIGKQHCGTYFTVRPAVESKVA